MTAKVKLTRQEQVEVALQRKGLTLGEQLFTDLELTEQVLGLLSQVQEEIRSGTPDTNRKAITCLHVILWQLPYTLEFLKVLEEHISQDSNFPFRTRECFFEDGVDLEMECIFAHIRARYNASRNNVREVWESIEEVWTALQRLGFEDATFFSDLFTLAMQHVEEDHTVLESSFMSKYPVCLRQIYLWYVPKAPKWSASYRPRPKREIAT